MANITGHRHYRLSAAYAILAGILWGGTGVFVRILASYGMDNITILEVKTGLASLMMLLLILMKDPTQLRVSRRQFIHLVILGLVGAFVLNYFFNYANMELSLSLATVIFSLSVFMVPMISSRMLGEHLSWKQYAYIVLAVTGCAFVSGLVEDGIGQGFEYSLLGVGAAFAAALCNAVFNVMSKNLLNKGCHTNTVNFYCLAVAAVAAIPLADWDVVADAVIQKPAESILVMLGQSFLMSVLPGLLYMQSVKYMKAATATALEVGTEPPAAMLFGLLFFAEIPSVLMVIGLVMVVAALLLMSRGER